MLSVVLLLSALSAQSLTAVRPLVSQSEDGPAIEAGQSFQPGELIFFSFQIENYKTSSTGKIELTGHAEAFDPAGKPIATKDEIAIGATVSDEDKSWKPKLRSQIQIPTLVPAGKYKIKFDVTDLQSKQTSTGETTFTVHTRTVEPSQSLAIRNFAFYRSQDDDIAIQNAGYKPGDMLWARFDITGYKYGDQNSIDVAYDVAVFRANGQSLFSQVDAAVEKSQAFYPQPWVPAEFNLILQSTMSEGPYTLVITAHDAGGRQTTKSQAEFRVSR